MINKFCKNPLWECSTTLVKVAGATVVGCGAAVEKVYQGGGEYIRRLGYRVESLARISSMTDDGNIEFC